MLYNTNELVKTVSANNAEDFDEKLNKTLREFGKKGIRYELRLAPELGFTAFIVYKETFTTPESIADEFQLGGEVHHCIECPYFVLPTDGRMKHSRCSLTQGVHRVDSVCCDAFYEKLLAGEIELREVMQFGKKEKEKV